MIVAHGLKVLGAMIPFLTHPHSTIPSTKTHFTLGVGAGTKKHNFLNIPLNGTDLGPKAEKTNLSNLGGQFATLGTNEKHCYFDELHPVGSE
jgi:hypothetical protein